MNKKLKNIIMWWDDDSDSEDWQIFKNMTFLKFWGNNQERDEMFESPGCLIIGIIVVVAVIICVILYATGTIK